MFRSKYGSISVLGKTCLGSTFFISRCMAFREETGHFWASWPQVQVLNRGQALQALPINILLGLEVSN
jgi:hypothetical protein